MQKDNEILLRQYELMANSAHQVTAWRQAANNFYLTVNTTLLALVGYLYNPLTPAVLIMSLIGIIVSVIWHQSISHYSKLNGAKFKVIHEMEKKLPIEMFRLEYVYFEKENCQKATQIEKKVPYIFAFAYSAVILLKLAYGLQLLVTSFWPHLYQ